MAKQLEALKYLSLRELITIIYEVRRDYIPHHFHINLLIF